METLLLRIGLDFEVRRLMFLLVNGLIPFVAVLSLLLLAVPGSEQHDLWVRQHALSLSGTLLCTVSVVVAAVLLRCHYEISVTGREIYRRIGRAPSAGEKLNWTGISASIYYLAIGSLVLGVLMLGWSHCLPWLPLSTFSLVVIAAGLIALRMTHSRVLQHSVTEVRERYGLPDEDICLSASTLMHSRASLQHTYADLSAATVIGIAIYGASLATIGAISKDFTNVAVCTAFADTVSRSMVDARVGIATYGLVAVLLAQLMIKRLCLAHAEYDARLTKKLNEGQSRWRIIVDTIFLIYFLLSLLGGSLLLFAVGYLVNTLTAAIAAVFYVSGSAFHYAVGTVALSRKTRSG